MAITLAQVLDAVATTLGAANGIGAGAGVVQSYDELTDGIAATPTLQVYPQSALDDVASQNNRTTFQAGVRQRQYTLHADVYARVRGVIGQDMNAVVVLADAVETKLDAQDVRPYFGLDGIQDYKWDMNRVTFDYGNYKYAGLRFVIRIWVY